MQFLIFLISFSLSGSCWACLWDRDTIRDEVRAKPSVYELITGQIPNHGSEYYVSRIREIGDKKDKQSLIDLGVACIRLGDFERAREIYTQLNAEYPETYEILSNLGVLYKKIGDFETAQDYIQRALALSPEGHMGLGDWYLKRITFELSSPDAVPSKNFLGEDYSAVNIGYLSRKKLTENRAERGRLLMTLIENDRHFSDAYLVLGDLLWEIADLNLAFRAYSMALRLGHPNEAEVNRRLDAVLQHWDYGIYSEENLPEGHVRRRQKELRALDREFEQGAEWLMRFHETEASLVKKGLFPSLDDTLQAMKLKKVYP